MVYKLIVCQRSKPNHIQAHQKKNVEKHALTPEKMNHLKNIFEQRINYVDEVSAGERIFFFQNMSINKSN